MQRKRNVVVQPPANAESKLTQENKRLVNQIFETRIKIDTTEPHRLPTRTSPLARNQNKFRTT